MGIDQLRHVIAKFHSTWERTIVNKAMEDDDDDAHCPPRPEQQHQHKQRSIKRPTKIVQQSQTQDDKNDLQQKQQTTLDLVLRALVDPDTYLLVPQPGFSILYQK